MHIGIGGVWTILVLVCNERIRDLFQFIEYAEILENESMSLIVSYNDNRGPCRYSNKSSA